MTRPPSGVEDSSLHARSRTSPLSFSHFLDASEMRITRGWSFFISLTSSVFLSSTHGPSPNSTTWSRFSSVHQYGALTWIRTIIGASGETSSTPRMSFLMFEISTEPSCFQVWRNSESMRTILTPSCAKNLMFFCGSGNQVRQAAMSLIP